MKFKILSKITLCLSLSISFLFASHHNQSSEKNVQIEQAVTDTYQKLNDVYVKNYAGSMSHFAIERSWVKDAFDQALKFSSGMAGGMEERFQGATFVALMTKMIKQRAKENGTKLPTEDEILSKIIKNILTEKDPLAGVPKPVQIIDQMAPPLPPRNPTPPLPPRNSPPSTIPSTLSNSLSLQEQLEQGRDKLRKSDSNTSKSVDNSADLTKALTNQIQQRADALNPDAVKEKGIKELQEMYVKQGKNEIEAKKLAKEQWQKEQAAHEADWN